MMGSAPYSEMVSHPLNVGLAAWLEPLWCVQPVDGPKEGCSKAPLVLRGGGMPMVSMP